MAKKWYYHCPICKKMVNKDENRFLLTLSTKDIQCIHKVCLRDELYDEDFLVEVKKIRKHLRDETKMAEKRS